MSRYNSLKRLQWLEMASQNAQALLSLIDLVYHGPERPVRAGGTSAVWHALAREHASLPQPIDTCPQVRC